MFRRKRKKNRPEKASIGHYLFLAWPPEVFLLGPTPLISPLNPRTHLPCALERGQRQKENPALCRLGDGRCLATHLVAIRGPLCSLPSISNVDKPWKHTVTFVDKGGEKYYSVNNIILRRLSQLACCFVELPDILHLRSSEEEDPRWWNR